MEKDAKFIPESVSDVLCMRPYEYWDALANGSVADFIKLWENFSDDELFGKCLPIVLLNFRRIINAYFHKNN